MSLVGFSDLYEINIDNVFQARVTGLLPEQIFTTDRKTLYIDEKYVLRRLAFKKYVTNRSHEMLYFLERYFPTSTVSYMLNRIDPSNSVGSWDVFLNKTMFTLDAKSVLSFKVTSMMWKFYRYARWILAFIFRKHSYNFYKCDLNKVHDLGDMKAGRRIK